MQVHVGSRSRLPPRSVLLCCAQRCPPDTRTPSSAPKLSSREIVELVFLCGGIGSIEYDRVLWTMKGKRKGVAVKISVSLQDTKKFWVPQESHVNFISYQFADVVELAALSMTASCGRNRECEMAQRSKFLGAPSRKEILGTARVTRRFINQLYLRMWWNWQL